MNNDDPMDGQSQPSTSNGTRRKRPSSPMSQIPLSRRPKLEVFPCKDTALKSTLPGTLYQNKLFLLAYIRSCGTNKKFKLGMEVDLAYKFDDFVLQIDDYWRFFQVKHTKEKITTQHLMPKTKKGPFCLGKYFISYLKIQLGDLIANGDDCSGIRDCTIITNSCFDDKLKDMGLFVECEGDESLDNDDIMYIEHSEAKCFKFNPIYINLEFPKFSGNDDNNTASDEADKFTSKSFFISFKTIFKQYLKATLKDLFESKKFEKKYTSIKKKLFESRPKESVILESEKEKIQMIADKQNIIAIQKSMSNAENYDALKIAGKSFFPESHFKNIQREDFENKKFNSLSILSNCILEFSLIEVALNEDIEDASIRKFMEKFRFIVNYPNEKEINNTIAPELSQKYILLDSDFVTNNLICEMLNYLLHSDNGTSYFITENHAKNENERTRVKIETIVAIGFTEYYCDQLKYDGIGFEPGCLERGLNGFLNSETEKVLIIQSPVVKLAMMRVHYYLMATNEKRDECIFIDLEKLLNNRNVILDAFRNEKAHNKLIIDCRNTHRIDKIMWILKIILKKSAPKNIDTNILLKTNIQKKQIILITNVEYKLQIKDTPTSSIKDDTSFESLNSEGKSTVLERNVMLQGKEIRLNKLIEKNQAKDIINSEILLTLIENNEMIEIGNESAFECNGYVSCYYINRKIIEYEDREESKDENYFCDEINDETPSVEKIMILSDPPGMGKSTVLTSLALGMRDTFHMNIVDRDYALWIFRINLTDYDNKQDLHGLHKIGSVIPLEFLSNILIPGDPMNDANIRFQWNILEKSLSIETKTRIVIFVDGFDEICPTHRDQVVELLMVLKNNTKISQMWVTTRLHEKDTLIQKLEPSAFCLCPLNLEEQAMFLKYHWEWQLLYNNEEKRPRTYKETIDKLKEIQTTDKLLEKKLSEIFKVSSAMDEEFDVMKHPEFSKLYMLWLSKYCDQNEQARIYNDIVAKMKNNQEEAKFIELLQKHSDLLHEIDDYEFKNIAYDLLNNFRESFSQSIEEFTTVPLHLEMLTISMFNANFQLTESTGLFHLYEQFFRHKITVYEIQKKRSQLTQATEAGIIHSIQWYGYIFRQLSVQLLLDESFDFVTDFISTYHKSFDKEGKDYKQDLARIGLMTLRNNSLQFVHRSFAEYFVSIFLIETLEKETIQEALINKILCEREFKLIRRFVNDQLKMEETRVDMSRRASKMSDIQANSLEQNLVIICEDGLNELFEFFCEHVKENTLKHLLIAIAKPENLMFNAINNNQVGIVKRLLSKMMEFSPEIVKTKMLMSVEHGSALIFAIRNTVDAIEVILEFVQNHQQELGKDYLKKLILFEGYFGLTVFQLAVEMSVPKIVRLLMKWPYLEGETIEKFLFSKASRQCQKNINIRSLINHNTVEVVSEVVQYIEQNAPALLKEFLLITDYYGRTPLTYVLAQEIDKDKQKQKQIVNILLSALTNNEELNDFLILSTYSVVIDPHLSTVETISTTFIQIRTLYPNFHSDFKEYFENESIFDETQINQLLEAINCGQVDVLKTILDDADKRHSRQKNDGNPPSEKFKECMRRYHFKIPAILIDKLLKLIDDDFGDIKEYITNIRDSVLEVEKRSKELHEAIHKGDIDEVQRILEIASEGKYIVQLMLAIPQGSMNAPLHAAAHQQQIGIFKHLLQNIGEKIPSQKMQSEIVMKITSSFEGSVLLVGTCQNYHDFVEELLRFVKCKIPKVFSVFLLTDIYVIQTYLYKYIDSPEISSFSKHHHEIARLIFDSAIDNDDLLVKIKDQVGPDKVHKWATANNHIKLIEKLDENSNNQSK